MYINIMWLNCVDQFGFLVKRVQCYFFHGLASNVSEHNVFYVASIEPQYEKTGLLVSLQVHYKPVCTVTEG